MRIVPKMALCLLLIAGLLAYPAAFAKTVQAGDTVCSGQAGCAHCAKGDSPRPMPMHGKAPAPAGSCCPVPVMEPVDVDGDCICSHTPGTPLTNTDGLVPAPTTKQLVAHHGAADARNARRADAPAHQDTVRPARGTPLPRLFLFLRIMSFRI
ncbi:hypothetical protein LF599_00895 [Pseudodesulfovibrio thermohalotolerans]|uniref:hypothetical protein n=1 Tax=Pseudodesulfovibrio thermohalotolerans TaxID=2880651 RepID=UPI0024435AB8|nr:hypothetical protein [Pseudodesulfovibrio thermohalotolerans]WFS62746.1 hypothetical protein LF599_00895 [Pseudodesulfovibrio thermohalotolerans]